MLQRSVRPGRERQQAYRERLREAGLHELRVRAPREAHDALRAAVSRWLDGDPVMRLASRLPAQTGRPAWRTRLLPWSKAQAFVLASFVGLAFALGAGFGAIVQVETDFANLRDATEQAQALREENRALLRERDELRAVAASARNEATRALADTSAIKTQIQALQTGVGGLRDQLVGSGETMTGHLPASLRDRNRAPTPPGPKIVPRSGADAEAEPARLPPASLAVYEFKLGDSLDQVARRFGTSLEAIIAANDALRPQPWRYGDRIVVPAAPVSRP
ncbi:MAG: LysM peptidoglycan-binding domain-containing protein [Alphaproteobacteria bacterium]|nr:LysM peptidoglycan-binding domain-containing protein [Alphaproteobacteria bacterium]